jgi:hypothetical protein
MKDLYNKSKYHWGSGLWKFIHSITIVDSDNTEYIYNTHKHIINILHNIVNIFPCSLCIAKYKEHLQKLDKLDLTQSMVLFYWSVDLHNDVNKKLNKPMWSYESARRELCTN